MVIKKGEFQVLKVVIYLCIHQITGQATTTKVKARLCFSLIRQEVGSRRNMTREKKGREKNYVPDNEARAEHLVQQS